MRQILNYTKSLGFLQGPTPNGTVVTVSHDQIGAKSYRLRWKGDWHARFGQSDLEREFGIAPRSKMSGGQEGYPSEPAIMALWRYLVDRYNEGDSNVRYSLTELPVVNSRSSLRPDDGEKLLASDLNDDAYPERRETVLQRLVRDTAKGRALKQRYENRCQICGVAVPLWDGLSYSEAHHIRPLGEPHKGPDSSGNILVLCPNHHAQCDFGGDQTGIGGVRVVPGHNIDKQYIDYHNSVIAKRGVLR